MPLKLIHPIVFGAIVIVLLVSVLVMKLIMLFTAGAISYDDKNYFNSAVTRKKFSIMSALFGTITLVGCFILVVLSLTLPTSTFLVTSNAVSIITILVSVLSGRIVAQIIK